MNYTTYLFDFDYTLADSSRGIVTCFRNVLNRHGYTQPTDDDIKRTIGKTLEDSFSILSGVTDPLQLAEFKKEYVKEADTHMTVNTVLFLETKSVLIALKDSGARIGIISTKFRYRIKELLDQHFPEDFLDIIIGGEDVKTPTPSPEGLLLAIKQLHVTKAETLYIGDSTVDAETAQKAGVDFAGITHGMTTAEELQRYPHKKIMDSLEELLKQEPLPAKAPKNSNVRQIIFFYANAVIFNRKDICGLRMYHGNCKHGTIAAIFDGIANDLSQHKLKSSTVCIDCFRLQFVENDKLLLFKKWGIVLQNFTQAVIQIDILKLIILCTAF